ncbi:nitrilase-related carbon-nitrogen hydrolase [Streptomyces sp. NPDC048290]|uniref:nitrilase-related carbon-nitrogen hydrolase n=1 Tax=Streptomyces sp. NPDC048290 TaxID=3155811 RepID=UPI0034172A4E
MSTTAGPGRSELRVVLAQLTPRPGDTAANLDRLESVLAGHADAELIVFPELFLTGYDLGAVREQALNAYGPEIGRVRELARRWRTAVAVGFPEATGDGVASSLACVDTDGTLAGVYRKTHLFGRERDHFTPGDRLAVVELAGVPVGPLICFDIEFPEPARTLALAGARLLVSVAANMAPYGPDHDLASRARALDNRLPHLYVNRTGREAPFTFTGHSRAVAPDGSLTLPLGPGEQVAPARIALGTAADWPTDYLHHLRPGLYGGQSRTARR